ncbi:hypothetical protein, variant [Aphanomyces invadans]|uniref:Lysosomal dipeptide transporter MFSD1 n=1 Tax=Aphanomyces invadans TaxID=157072 RepID=A0A024UJV3_9STRA|nr:hypothetical protein, variant [Aphanomyces invadans]ETW06152.1 hypothetical protein, variant [Aphanomyces invadans]|eukprot:XP_008865929.1 hypothetical protein, variant [Aphanomyces invadans]
MEKSELPVRWLILFLSCTLMIGNYYCFDNPAALKSQLQQHFNNLPADRYEFLYNLLYTLYSIPNIILPFCGGFLVDRLGARVTLLLFAGIITTGQVVFAIGCSTTQFNIMLLGRVLFGLGGESLGVAQSTLVASWFKNKELAMALGINLSIARLGSVFNNELSPEIASEYNVSSALWVGVIMCGVSLIAALTLIPIDKRADAAIARAARHPSSSSLPVKKSDQSMSFNDLRQFGPLFWLLSMSCLVVYGCVIPFNSVASSLLMERDLFKSPPIECRRCDVGAYATHNCTALAPSCPSVPPFAWPLPALNQNCSTITTAAEQDLCSHLPPYIDERSINCDSDAWKHGTYSRDFCKHKSAAASAAATPMSVPYLMSAVLSPFMGFAVDRVGCRAFLALAAALTLVVVHLLLGLTDATYWLPLSLQGLAYCVFAAALWPSIPSVVEPHMVGSAYGVITSIQVRGEDTMLMASRSCVGRTWALLEFRSWSRSSLTCISRTFPGSKCSLSL